MKPQERNSPAQLDRKRVAQLRKLELRKLELRKLAWMPTQGESTEAIARTRLNRKLLRQATVGCD